MWPDDVKLIFRVWVCADNGVRQLQQACHMVIQLHHQRGCLQLQDGSPAGVSNLHTRRLACTGLMAYRARVANVRGRATNTTLTPHSSVAAPCHTHTLVPLPEATGGSSGKRLATRRAVTAPCSLGPELATAAALDEEEAGGDAAAAAVLASSCCALLLSCSAPTRRFFAGRRHTASSSPLSIPPSLPSSESELKAYTAAVHRAGVGKWTATLMRMARHFACGCHIP